MRLVDNRGLVKSAATRWERQYQDTSSVEWRAITKSLKELKNPTASKIEKIIGNESWTKLFCSDCSNYHAAAIEFGEYENRLVCFDCVRSAARLIPKKRKKKQTP